MNDEQEGVIYISTEENIVTARKQAREVAKEMGFGITDVTRIVTAASELARNIYRFSGSGIMRWKILKSENHAGIELVFEDEGPGIPDIEQAMEIGYTTIGGLGMGLPGAKRLMDEMEVVSEVNKGTKVIIRKWLTGIKVEKI